MNVVTITEDDNATSSHGKNKVKVCGRSELDCVFFAGPCAGGAAWNRLNRTISNKAAMQVEKRKRLYWTLWNCFADILEHVFSIDAYALTEFPRSCEYWNDVRVQQLVNGTGSHVHHFDGCVYGFTSQFNKKRVPIKKPWKIVSWGVHFQELKKTCDGRHQHVPCAGRDSRVMRLYTVKIAQAIVDTLNKRIMSLWKRKRVTRRAPRLQDWSSTPRPLLQNGQLCTEASLKKKFDRIIQAVRESKKKQFHVEQAHDESEISLVSIICCLAISIPTGAAISTSTWSGSSSGSASLTSIQRRRAIHRISLPLSYTSSILVRLNIWTQCHRL